MVYRYVNGETTAQDCIPRWTYGKLWCGTLLHDWGVKNWHGIAASRLKWGVLTLWVHHDVVQRSADGYLWRVTNERTLSCPLHVLSSFGLGLCANSFRHSTDHLWSSLISLSSLPSLSLLGSAQHGGYTLWLTKELAFRRIVESEVAAEIWASRPHECRRTRKNATAMCNRLAVSGFQLHSICRALRC